jgi:hypothetical protein
MVTKERGAELGKAGGYENGYCWGKISGTVGAIGTAGAVYAGGTVVVATAPLIAAGVGVGALGYLAGGFVGGIFGSWRGKNAGENKSIEPNTTEQQVLEYAKKEGGEAGFVAGVLAGIATGAATAVAVEKGLLEVLIGECVDKVSDIPIPDIVSTKQAEVFNSTIIGESSHCFVTDTTNLLTH